MKARYKRELNHNYLILEEETYEETYQVKMLTRNRIPGFLECRVSRLGERADFSYDITSRQSLSLVLERKRISAEEFLNLLKSLERAAESCMEYFLNTENLVLDPDYIYLDPDGWNPEFCFFPGEEEPMGEKLLGLAEYLLDRLNRQEPEAVTIGYEFYRMAGEENGSLEELLEKWKHLPEKESPEAGKKQPEGPTDGGTVFLRPEKKKLILKSEDGNWPDWQVEGDTFLIGKKKDAVDGWLKARGISRIHGKISREGDCYYLTDLNSTNGTYLNGGRLEVNEKARLRPGDCVCFADVRYVVEG